MNQLLRPTKVATLGLAMLTLVVSCKKDDANDVEARSELVLACVDTTNPSTDPICPAAFNLECGEPGDVTLAVSPPSGAACADVNFQSSLSAPYPVGVHNVTISATDKNGAVLGDVCSTTVTVQDSTAPEATSNNLQLWPPNHKMETITVDSCVNVVDSCDPDVKVAFTRVTSNEAEDGKGDGHHAPDIEVIDCSQVNVRRERSGNAGGRVYTFEWIARDAAGNETVGTCTAGVAHDQSKKSKKPQGTTPMITVDIDPSDCVDDPPGDDDDDDTTTSTDTTSTDTSTETTSTDTSTETTSTDTTSTTTIPPV